MSPQSWLGKSIYFILTDRFYNGDKSNDDFGQGEYDPQSDDCFQGGDLNGITRKLPHIRKLGFDAIWLTPPVHNQWINPYIATRGFHGYWAYDFTRVDPHFGTLEDYKRLVREAHKLGLKVIQDIVVNHTGNFFTVDDKGYDPRKPEKNWRGVIKKGAKAPRDPVFKLNNPNNPAHKKAGVYNFTPNISDFKSREQTLTYSMGDLDDINLRSPLAANRMKEIYRYWIEEVGIDGYRVDTVYYTPEDFYEGFLYDDSPQHPGIKRGNKDFFVFGEVWSYDYKAINKYLKDGRTKRLDSAIDLPLNEALTQVFYRKTPTEDLRKALSARRHNRNLWVNFLDNHDVERMNSRANWRSVRQSLVALFTLPGIPCVYYGTEAGFKAARQNMFKDSCYDEKSKYCRFLRQLLRLRKQHPALSRGACSVERASFSCGVLSYAVEHAGERYLMVFNTAPDRMFYELEEGRSYQVLLSSEKDRAAGGAMILAPESYYVLKAGGRKEKAGKGRPNIRMRPLRPGTYSDDIGIRFRLDKPGKISGLYLLSNDNFDKRVKIAQPRDGKLSLRAAELDNGKHRLRLLAKTGTQSFSASASSEITVRNAYRRLTDFTLPAGNKGGLDCELHIPADPSYDRQCSIERVSVYSSGRDLRLQLKMANVTDDWNPPHGYDHVYFNVLFDFPGEKGRCFFPKMNYRCRDFAFNAGFLLYGWGAQSYGTKGASEDAYGEPLFGEIVQAADLKTQTITFTFSSKFFDSLKTLDGVKIFLSTWDGYLADFRKIANRKSDWEFYTLKSGRIEDVPRIFDYAIIRI
ncbi:MAG: alpha-amylase family glycosyl hydrolase [Elusimicrobiota bacterium]